MKESFNRSGGRRAGLARLSGLNLVSALNASPVELAKAVEAER
jgi:hypothetical protein